MNNELTKVFIEEEVCITLNQMNPTKVLGPDGIVPIFSNYWNIVGKLVTSTVL